MTSFNWREREVVESMSGSTKSCTGHSSDRIEVDGKFFRLGLGKWSVKGFSYGPFAPNSNGFFLPERNKWLADLAVMQSLGANSFRVYHTPPRQLLDDALEHGLRVLIDVPWEKHRCFLEDWASQEEARRRVRETARALGGHPGVFAISVVNEFPIDVVRFHGHRKLERFVRELIDVVKQESPECLATFVNFPTTEFLEAPTSDFSCFNVYLHDSESLGAYLDRLQHIAGNRPLILGEYGICTIRCGEDQQSELLSEHIHQVFRHGLAGSYIFSFTDDWYTGGYQIEDWAFGVTRRDRSEKPCASALREIWDRAPQVDDLDLPRVSIVVCSYNGGATLDECLKSLMELKYQHFYEVILIDDGSTDSTSEIAERYPGVLYHYQKNRGLSAARNVGAKLAIGEVVVYTDSDCVADPDWLYYLIRGMQDQNVPAIGGPNIPPSGDCPVARCVAASPGGPSQVMLDDRLAEHVPGCNMAFRRDLLLELGGFDEQFRQAGDDVDFCWRWQDAGHAIGYAAAAMVWHHRRNSVSAYLKQQKGYGRSEAMVYRKHPHRFTSLGYSLWKGVIYGDGAVGLPNRAPLIYQGRFGSSPFQAIYRQSSYSAWAWVMTLEWQLIALCTIPLSFALPGSWMVGLLMCLMTLGAAIRSTVLTSLPGGSPFWSRPLIFLLHLLQPIVRGWHRHRQVIFQRSLPEASPRGSLARRQVKKISSGAVDLYWESENGFGRERLLDIVVNEARRAGWSGEFGNDWKAWDVCVSGDLLYDITIRTATEELGWPRRYTRARCTLVPSLYCRALIALVGVWCLSALVGLKPWAMISGLIAIAAVTVLNLVRRQACLRSVVELLWRAGLSTGLQPVYWSHDVVPEEMKELVVEPTQQDTEGSPSVFTAPEPELARG